MPELSEDMYCSQQICIPPSFPYLLRQYAKAAIRTQPVDLLRWSTAYFRSLSLNLPPPVKPRLEYPIPKSYFGLTPGWLRALVYQLQNSVHVSFKVLWDRWIGACLQHQNLIEVLCLGSFNNPEEIPWFRFVALCAAHLTDSLTQTMIMVCEILTEEPEGGSAMVPLEVFTDTYQFLAAIDASQPQTLINIHFSDSLLSLYREQPVVKVEVSVGEAEEEVEEESEESSEYEYVRVQVEAEKDMTGVVISCPDIAADDYKIEEDFLPADDDGTKASTEEPKEPDWNEVQSVNSKELLEDLEKVRKAQALEMKTDGELEAEEEETEEVDLEIEKLKRLLAAPPGMEPSSESEVFIVSEESDERKEAVEEDEAPAEQEFQGEEVHVEAIPGIGPVVPDRLVEAVLAYMQACAKNQHGTVMPRNVRHHACPPLEVLQ